MSADEGARRTALVVLGSHRSGTSAMTRVLGLSGARLPKDCHPPGPDNERGFWESQAVIALDEEMLSAYDSGWDDIFAGQSRRHLSNFDRVFRSRAAETIQAVFEDGDPIVLKDPRINVLAAFWDGALRSQSFEPVYVIMVRNAAEAAASMLVRNSMVTDQGLLLWLDNMLAAERDTRHARRLFVAYDDLLEDWRSCLDRVEQAWGQLLPRRTSTASNSIEKFLSPGLRHHRASERALQATSPVREMASEAYAWFHASSQTTEALDGGVPDALRKRLSGLRETIEPVLVEQRTRLADYIKHAEALNASRTQVATELDEARRRLAARAAEDAARGEMDAARELRMQELHEELEAFRSRALGAEAELEAFQIRCSDLAETLRRAQAVAEDALDQSRSLEAQLAAESESKAVHAHAAQEQAAERQRISAEADAMQARHAEELDRLHQLHARDLAEWSERLARQQDGLEAQLSQAATERAAAESVAETLRSELIQVQGDVANLRAYQVAAGRELHRLQGGQAEREREIEKLRTQHVDARREIDGLHLDRAEAERQIMSLCAERDTATDQISNLRAQRDDTRAELESVRAVQASAQQEIDRLRADQARILNSTSWKLGALPRRLISRLRRD